MRLVSLQLKNYRKYADEFIEFPDGLIGIIGPNGAGKSTLIEAIGWALYGNPAARTTKEQIKRQESSSKDICQVILELEIGNDHYQIVREMRRSGLSSDAAVYASLSENKKAVARGIPATLDYITRLTGLNKDAFFTSFFAKQNELNALADLQPAERKNLIVKMLKISDVDKAIDFLKQDLRDISMQLDTLKSAFLSDDKLDINSLKIALEAKMDEKKESERRLLKIKQAEETLKAKYEKIRTEFDKEDRKKETRNQLLEEYRFKEGELKNIKQNLEHLNEEEEKLSIQAENLKNLEPTFSLFEETKKEVEDWGEIKNKQKLIHELSNQLSQLEKDINKKERELKELRNVPAAYEGIEKEIKEIESSLETLRNLHNLNQKERHNEEALIAHLNENIEKLTKQTKDINLLGKESPCPTCFRPLGGDFEKIQKHLTDEIQTNLSQIKELKEKIEKLKNAESDLSEQILKTQERLRELAQKKEVIIQKKQEITHFQQIIEEYGAKRRETEKKLKEIGLVVYDEKKHLKEKEILEKLSLKRDKALKIKASLERLPEVKEKIKAYDKKKITLEKELEKIKKEGQELCFSQKNYEQIKKAAESTKEELHQKQLEIRDLTHQDTIISRDIEDIEKSIQDYEKKKEKIQKLNQERQVFDLLLIQLTDFRKTLAGRIRPTLSEKASEFLRELTDGKYLALELNEDYEIFIEDNGEKFSLERFSGGEKDLSSLCLRLAISQLMSESASLANLTDNSGFNEPGFIVLDEIFGSQDPTRKNNILQALAKLSNQFRQIFLITHIEDIKDSIEYAIIVEEDEAGLSHLRLE